MSPRRIQLSRARGWRLPENTIVASRPGPWGNHYRIGKPVIHIDGRRVVAETTDQAAQYFEEWLDYWMRESAEFRRVVQAELRNRNLACWCPPGQRCHADALLRHANGGDAPAADPPPRRRISLLQAARIHNARISA